MKTIFTALFLILVAIAIFTAANKYQQKDIPPAIQDNQSAPQNISVQNDNQPDISSQKTLNATGFQPPLDRAKERVTKKPFGIYITPATSPIEPERFQGYHTGTDFEIFPEELSADVWVKAICSGKLMVKEYASGYGGVAVQSCELDNNPITVIYGHLKLSSISVKAGEDLKAGEEIGMLGVGNTAETNGERKHLHLGVHKGTSINIRGYVNSKMELSNWMDVCQYACSS